MFYYFSFCNQIIRKKYCDYLEDRQSQILVFDSDVMLLDLPAAGALVDGWRILPLTFPQVPIVHYYYYYYLCSGS